MKYKLTMVSVASRGKRITRFLKLPYDAQGRATLPEKILSRMLDELGAFPGGTYTVG
jgi:hypothetical protein